MNSITSFICTLMNRIVFGLLIAMMLIIYRNSHAAELPGIDNWQTHPAIEEVRQLYNQIQQNSSNGIYPTKTRAFKVQATQCGVYPMREKSISLDERGKVRKLVMLQLVSDGAPLRVERFYDERGALRFVFSRLLLTDLRIYLSARGEVIWAMEFYDNKREITERVKGDWETVPATADEALALFNRKEACPEIPPNSTTPTH
ncbi:MAG: hypothetical protein OEZ39_00330 [Gammaproteobacteria bacterium]|nr:hypothetical protein [Gammaproteobacteria bacterium]MDH5650294.1 hypothetical protein [Gammaproteobacteria bacterium]